MRAVYYSLAALGNAACERQWVQSIRSLRRHNREIWVYLVVWGAPRAETLAEAARQGVCVVDVGAYAGAFTHLPPAWAEILRRNPTLHKILSLRHFPTDQLDQLLYLDSDTFFLGDVEGLFSLYRGQHFLAREEPGSRRSHYGYDSGYIDEDALAAIARGDGRTSVPPYNTGIFLMNGGLWNHLRALVDDFLVCAWRLMVGLRFASLAGAAPDSAAARLLDCGTTDEDRRGCLPYPSSNSWIVEEIALWLSLGRVAGLTHGAFRRAHVAQNGEALAIGAQRGPLPVVAHYFSGLEEQFFARLRLLDALKETIP
jgi:hypothetical protein